MKPRILLATEIEPSCSASRRPSSSKMLITSQENIDRFFNTETWPHSAQTEDRINDNCNDNIYATLISPTHVLGRRVFPEAAGIRRSVINTEAIRARHESYPSADRLSYTRDFKLALGYCRISHTDYRPCSYIFYLAT